MTSSFAETLAAAKPTSRGPSCSVGAWRAALDKADAHDFDAALANLDLPIALITRAMKQLGYTSNANTLGRHRRGECKCDHVV